MAIAYADKFGLPILIIRLFNTIGPRQSGRYGMVIPGFVEQACTNQPMTLYGDGTQTQSFCDVHDVTIAVDTLANKLRGRGEIFNIGNAHEITINALANLVKKRAHSDSLLTYLPFATVYGDNYYEIKQRRPDLSKLYHHTQCTAQISLEATIDDLIGKFRDHNMPRSESKVLLCDILSSPGSMFFEPILTHRVVFCCWCCAQPRIYWQA